MEKRTFEQRSKEAQASTLKHSFRTFGGDGQGSWVNVEVCGWNEAVYIDTKKEDGSDTII